MGRVVRAVLLAGAIAGALGCSATSGSTWVSEPEAGPFAGETFAVSTSEHHFETADEPATSRLISDRELAGERQTRPRLDRTITLGEVVTGVPERAAAQPVGDRAPVTVTVNNYVSTQPNNNDGYYSGYYAAPLIVGAARPIDGRPGQSRPQPRPTMPGQNWPAPPSYGPAFPFKTAPASPWAPAR